MIVFSTKRFDYLAGQICELGGFRVGGVEHRDFPDGEHYHRIANDVYGQDAVLVGGTITDRDALELYDLASGLVQERVRTLTLLIPYFGYSTMERAIRGGEIVTAKVRARLLSSIPHASRGNRLVLLDLHSVGITYYFEGVTHAVHLTARPVIVEAARRIARTGFVVASADAGRAKWVERLANDLDVDVNYVFKRRGADGRTQVTAVSAEVEGRPVIIYDDMIRTGGSILQAAEAYRQAGAASVAAIATHGVFPGDALERMRASGLLTEVVCTNSHPRAVELAEKAGGFLKLESVAGVFTEFLRQEPP